MDLTDRALIEAYRRGDKQSFDLLVLRYLKLVYSVVLHYVKDVSEAEDLTQDVFIKVMRHLGSYDSDRNFKPWVLQIARNQALDWIKKRKPLLASALETEEHENLLDQIPDPTPLAETIASQKEIFAELSASVKTLSMADRKLLFYRYIRGLSFREIGEEIGEVLDTVKSRHRRILVRLRKKIFDTSMLS